MTSLLLPPEVSPSNEAGAIDRGVYFVASQTRLGLRHRVDVEEMACDCEAATKGIYWRLQMDGGKQWANLCPHLKTALAAHGVICALAFRKDEQ